MIAKFQIDIVEMEKKTIELSSLMVQYDTAPKEHVQSTQINEVSYML